jgi:hypothetical protein
MLLSIVTLSLLLIRCGGEHADPESQPAAATPAAASAAAAAAIPAAAATGTATVRDAAGAEVVTVREQADGSVAITFMADGAKRTLHGARRDTGKRKYNIGDGPLMFEVKPGDSGFKLRMADGTLRWKVKLAPEKIKVSDNEQNANPYELKMRDGDRIKVVAPGDRELGNVRYDRAASKSSVDDAASKNLFVIEGKQSAAYGVLLLDAIPPPQRYILLAELLSSGR